MRLRAARAHRSTGSRAEVIAPRRAGRACEEAERGAGAPASNEAGCGAEVIAPMRAGRACEEAERGAVAPASDEAECGAEVIAPRRAGRACEEAERGAGAPASDEPGCGAEAHVRMKLSELAERLDCRLEGDGDVEIVRVASIRHALPGDLTFLANPKYAVQLSETRASAVILGLSSPEPEEVPPTCAVV